MELPAGTRWRSQVCSTEIIVVRGGEIPGSLTCGGAPMVPIDASSTQASTATGRPAAGLDSGTQVGKRYSDGASLELLVTKAGDGALGIDQTPLDIKGARPLPSSD